MSELEVRIVKLEPMRVVSAYGFGPSPEGIASDKMNAFLKSKGMLEGYGKDFISYGFNNPNPSAGSPNYGYEIWVPVTQAVEPDGDIRVVEFEGGLYAVTRFTNLEKIGQVWGELVRWRENSKYKKAFHQWLEGMLNPSEMDMTKYTFDLYLPISE